MNSQLSILGKRNRAWAIGSRSPTQRFEVQVVLLHVLYELFQAADPSPLPLLELRAQSLISRFPGSVRLRPFAPEKRVHVLELSRGCVLRFGMVRQGGSKEVSAPSRIVCVDPAATPLSSRAVKASFKVLLVAEEQQAPGADIRLLGPYVQQHNEDLDREFLVVQGQQRILNVALHEALPLPRERFAIDHLHKFTTHAYARAAFPQYPVVTFIGTKSLVCLAQLCQLLRQHVASRVPQSAVCGALLKHLVHINPVTKLDPVGIVQVAVGPREVAVKMVRDLCENGVHARECFFALVCVPSVEADTCIAVVKEWGGGDLRDAPEVIGAGLCSVAAQVEEESQKEGGKGVLKALLQLALCTALDRQRKPVHSLLQLALTQQGKREGNLRLDAIRIQERGLAQEALRLSVAAQALQGLAAEVVRHQEGCLRPDAPLKPLDGLLLPALVAHGHADVRHGLVSRRVEPDGCLPVLHGFLQVTTPGLNVAPLQSQCGPGLALPHLSPAGDLTHLLVSMLFVASLRVVGLLRDPVQPKLGDLALSTHPFELPYYHHILWEEL
eukprot:scaffold258_cov354-Prasinococcus_capsulatus_cf.AAC.6